MKDFRGIMTAMRCVYIPMHALCCDSQSVSRFPPQNLNHHTTTLHINPPPHRRELREDAIIDNARHKLRRVLPAHTFIDISKDPVPPHFVG